MSKLISGKVSYTKWNFISGRFMIGKNKIHVGNIVRIFILRASKWAKVRIDEDGFLIELINVRRTCRTD